jgi:hypothetical protein
MIYDMIIIVAGCLLHVCSVTQLNYVIERSGAVLVVRSEPVSLAVFLLFCLIIMIQGNVATFGGRRIGYGDDDMGGWMMDGWMGGWH